MSEYTHFPRGSYYRTDRPVLCLKNIFKLPGSLLTVETVVGSKHPKMHIKKTIYLCKISNPTRSGRRVCYYKNRTHL